MTYHLAGDSTVADGQPDETPMSGWGGCLAAHVDEPVCNLAFGGATTETFIASERWPLLLAQIRPGDTVVIQFGHNDQKQSHLDARGGYTDRLRHMVEEVRARRGRVVLCTSVERRWFDGARVIPTHGDYPNAVRDLAAELDTPLIDLTAFTTWLYEDLGPEASRDLLSHFAPGEHPRWPDGLTDDTHFHVRGAQRIAAYVGAALGGIDRKGGDGRAMGSPSVS